MLSKLFKKINYEREIISVFGTLLKILLYIKSKRERKFLHSLLGKVMNHSNVLYWCCIHEQFPAK